MRACAAHQFDDVAAQLVVDSDGAHRLLATDDFVGRHNGLEIIDWVFELVPAEHRRFFLGVGISQIESDQKPIELSFGQGEGAFMIDRILSRNDQKRRRQIKRGAVDGDLALAHRFQQGRLGARSGAVDLVSQNNLRKDRTWSKLELGRLLVEDGSAGDIRRQQVRRALHPLECGSDAAGQRPREHRLGHSRHILE